MVSVNSKTQTFTNGTANDAGPVDSEFTALFNNDATLASALTTIENGSIPTATTLTINSAYTGGSPGNMAFMVERGAQTNTGLRWNETDDRWEVTNDGTNYYPIALVVSEDPGTPTEGMVWYNTTSNQLKFYDGTDTIVVANAANVGIFPKGYLSGPPVRYNAAASIIVPAGLKARSSDNTADIEVSGDITVSLASSGAAGLDTGSEASNTWYYVYLIKKSSNGTVSAVFSTTNEAVSGSITYPSGYDLKRQLPIAVRNDNSSNIIPFFIGAGWPSRPLVLYNVAFTPGASGATTLVYGNSSMPTSFTDLVGSSFIPPISKLGLLLGHSYTGGNSTNIRTKGSSTNGFAMTGIANPSLVQETFFLETDSSQTYQYKTDNAANAVGIHVMGFVVTEVN